MTDQAYDGTPIQAGVQDQGLTGTYPQFSILGVREMVVIGRRFKKDEFNRSKTQVEYIVRDLRTGDVFPGARRIDVLGGAVNGEDNVLHPAEKIRKNTSGDVGFQTPADSTDGDRVLVAFLEGSRSQPVIIGVFRHPDATYGSVEDDGERRYTIHNGTSVEFDKDGQYTLIHKSGSRLKFLDNGDVELEPAGNLLLSGASGLPNEGALNGDAVDPFTGSKHFVLGNASTKTFTTK